MPFPVSRLPFPAIETVGRVAFGEMHIIGNPPLAAEFGAIGHWVFGQDRPDMLDLVSNQPLRRAVVFAMTAGGSGYTTPTTTVTLSGTGWEGAVATPVITSGAVTDIVIGAMPTAQPTAAPTVTINSSGGGTGATATATLAAAPTFLDGCMVMGAGCRMVTPIAEPATHTVIAIAKPMPGQGTVFGTWTANTSQFGAAMIYTAGSGYQLTRPSSLTILAEGGDAGAGYLAYAMSEYTGGRRGKIGGHPAVADATVRTNSTPRRNIAIGSAYLAPASSYAAAPTIAELIVFSSVKTEAEMIAVFQKSALRLAPRGIGFETT